MHHLPRRWTRSAVWMLSCALVAGSCAAQTWYPPPPVAAPAPPVAPPPSRMPAPARLAAPQLEQLLAPIALYPDPLLANLLTAATYPEDVVEAAEWLRQPGNAALAGDALATALAGLPWDASVKSLVPFPEVLRLLNDNRAWTEQLGGAFIVQQADVMDAVQTLRQRASQNGNLRSTPQAYVQTQGQTIIIEPPTPQYVYVPVYDPLEVYGPWPYSAYPPRRFSGYFSGATYFGTGMSIGWFGLSFEQERWRWNRWDWGARRLVVYQDRYERYGHYHDHDRFDDGYWRHDPHWRGRRDGDDHWRDRPRGQAPDRGRDFDQGGKRPEAPDGRGGGRFPPAGPVGTSPRGEHGNGRFPGAGSDDRGPRDRGDRGQTGGREPPPDGRNTPVPGTLPPTGPVIPPGAQPAARTPDSPSRWPAGSVPDAVVNRQPDRGAARFPTLPAAPLPSSGEQVGPPVALPPPNPAPFAREGRPGLPVAPLQPNPMPFSREVRPGLPAPAAPPSPPSLPGLRGGESLPSAVERAVPRAMPQPAPQMPEPPQSRFRPPPMEEWRMPEPRLQMPVERPMPRAMPEMRAPPAMPERQERFQPRQFEAGPQRERGERRERREDERR